MSEESENRTDHNRLMSMVADVLREIKEIRIDMRESLASNHDEIAKMREDMFEEKRRVDEVERTNGGLKRALWLVGGAACTVSGLAIGKAMGIL